MQSSGCRVQGAGFRVQGAKLRVQAYDLGFIYSGVIAPQQPQTNPKP